MFWLMFAPGIYILIALLVGNGIYAYQQNKNPPGTYPDWFAINWCAILWLPFLLLLPVLGIMKLERYVINEIMSPKTNVKELSHD